MTFDEIEWRHIDRLVTDHNYTEELASYIVVAALSQKWPRWSPLGAALALWRPPSEGS